MDKVTNFYSETHIIREGEMSGVTLHAFVESEAIARLWWSNLKNPNGNLTVTFTNGQRYIYEDVPSQVFAKVMSAESVGRAFNEYVRKNYAGKKEVVTW